MQLDDGDLLATAVGLISQAVKSQDEEFFDRDAQAKNIDVQTLLLILPLSGAPADVDYNARVVITQLASTAAWALRSLQRTRTDFDAQEWLASIAPRVQGLSTEGDPA